MPIRPELKQFYGVEWKTITRPRILARAGDCCEQCKVPNHAVVLRVDAAWCLLDGGTWRGGREEPAFAAASSYRVVRIVLTIAHLNHVAGDDRPENLKALCQWCHLNYDLNYHHVTRATRKDAARPLLVERSKIDAQMVAG